MRALTPLQLAVLRALADGRGRMARAELDAAVGVHGLWKALNELRRQGFAWGAYLGNGYFWNLSDAGRAYLAEMGE